MDKLAPHIHLDYKTYNTHINRWIAARKSLTSQLENLWQRTKIKCSFDNIDAKRTESLATHNSHSNVTHATNTHTHPNDNQMYTQGGDKGQREIDRGSNLSENGMHANILMYILFALCTVGDVLRTIHTIHLSIFNRWRIQHTVLESVCGWFWEHALTLDLCLGLGQHPVYQHAKHSQRVCVFLWANLIYLVPFYSIDSFVCTSWALSKYVSRMCNSCIRKKSSSWLWCSSDAISIMLFHTVDIEQWNQLS